MKHEMTDSYKLDVGDDAIIVQAMQILDNIIKEMEQVATHMIDEQKFPQQIDDLIFTAMKLEDKKIFSAFNYLDEDQRDRLRQQIRANFDWGQTEVCSDCGKENFYRGWNPKEKGYVAECEGCGREIMLCDACTHAEDNPNHKCDWHKENGMSVCFRGTHKLWEE